MVNISINETGLRIEMLGGFVISYNGRRITEQMKRSSKTWKLIQYLVVHRYKTVPQEELSDVFCDSDSLGDPGNTVRTMVYRARTALSASGLPNAEKMILSGSGGYRWNNDVNCFIDSEEFETLLKMASSETDREVRLGLILKATELYRGEFLSSSSGELWVMPLARWYRTAFINSVYEALDILTDKGRNFEAEELCAKALRTDPFDEKILEYHLRSLVIQGKNSEALEECRKTESMFFDVLGVSFSDSLNDLYSQIQSRDTGEERSLENLMFDWLDGADFPGAYYCDVNVFKTVYQIECRSAARSGRTVYIIRIDTGYEAGSKEDGVMRQLGRIIPLNLRKGDLFTRSAPGQFMLMLNSLTYDNCKMLATRIVNSLDPKYQTVVKETTIKPVKSAGNSAS